MASSLGMPALPPRTTAPPWRSAWDVALYGAGGFYREHSPADHFRTSVHGSDLSAEALLTVARRHGLTRVVDVGAGRGELLRGLHRLDPGLELVAVEVADRPAGLPDAIGWSRSLPDRVDGLVVAHEWLDNVPCHVVEVDDAGRPRVVHVDPVTGVESLGLAVDEPGVPDTIGAWLDRWWPLAGREPGARAEVGSTRDQAWAGVVGRLGRGLAVAVDYGHTLDRRPPFGALRGYADGREVEPLPDGSRDVTAAVAVDSVAARVGAELLRQREALAALGLSPARPPLDLATSAPQEYAARLARASQVADLTATGGLGDFYWVVSGAGGVVPSLGGG
jgi:SAM-dependent MidA family methyltransferase